MKLSDELVLDARLIGAAAERSIAGQIEFWAHLGRAVEPLLDGARALALRRSGSVKPLSQSLSDFDSPEGRKRVFEYLQSQPFPHYEAAREGGGLLVRIDEDGTRTLGRFVDREFRASE